MKRTFFCVFFFVMILALQTTTADEGSYKIDLTHHFLEETRWLAENVTRESRDEHMLRTRGIVQYADVKPPEVGDIESFNTFNLVTGNYEQLNARLMKIGEHCYIYLEEGQNVSNSVLNRIKNEFDNSIYPITRKWFGSEWSPGIDDDPRITLLLLDIRDGYNPSQGRRGFTAGYFYAGDNYLRSKNPHSNERSMLYLDINPTDPSSDTFLSVIAHEFQHMIHWNQDPKEFIWLNEAMSQLAQFVAGYGHPEQLNRYIERPGNSLVAWSRDSTIANYGKVYLWAYYISTTVASTPNRRREFMRRIVRNQKQGMQSIDDAIRLQRIRTDVNTLFNNFSVATYLNDSRIERGVYGFDDNLARLFLRPQVNLSAPPFEGYSRVRTWSSTAIKINPQSFIGKSVNVSFAGQRLHAGSFENSYDVAAVSYSTNRNEVLPKVQWLDVNDNHEAFGTFNMPSNHDKFLLVVVNRGPTNMQIEQSFARHSPSAEFSYSVSTSRSDVAPSLSQRMVARSQLNPQTAERMLNAIMLSPSQSEISNLMMSVRGTDSAREVELDFRSQRISQYEKRIASSLQRAIGSSDYSLVATFNDVWQQADQQQRERLAPIHRRLFGMLRFQYGHGCDQAAEMIELISQGSNASGLSH